MKSLEDWWRDGKITKGGFPPYPIRHGDALWDITGEVTTVVDSHAKNLIVPTRRTTDDHIETSLPRV